MSRTSLALGALFGLTGVAAGAFGAHSLKAVLAPDMFGVFETAVRYQMYHALALVLAGLPGLHFRTGALRAASWMFAIGIVLFSGSLYALAFSGIRWLGALTPLGGVAFLARWGLLAWACWKESRADG